MALRVWTDQTEVVSFSQTLPFVPDVLMLLNSVTRLGDLLHFGLLFRACGNNYLAQIAHIFWNFCKCVKIFHFSSDIIFGQLL